MYSLIKKIILFICIIIITLIVIIHNKDCSELPPLINILTRTGNRRKCYENLKKSLRLQTYTNYRHIKSCDNIACNFLNDEKDVYRVKNLKKYRDNHCPYNLYLNTLIDKVKKGWIIVVDDDAKFIDTNFLMNLSRVLSTADKNKILVHSIYAGKEKSIMLRKDRVDIKNIRDGQIDMGCIIFHCTNKTRFKEICGGDVFFFKEAVETYDPVFIDIPIGIWINYKGWAHGNNVDC